MAEMTPQKALEILDMFLHKQCDLQRTEFAYSQNEVYMAVSMAKYALKKPIQETTEQSKSLTLVFGKDGKATILNEDYVIYCADEETFEMVKAAVEKQTPKKVVKKNPICYSKTKAGQESYAYDYHCPVCDTKLKTNEHHCPCGQALDWSDTE